VRVLVLGADGQVGQELCGALGCFAEVVPATESDFDITDRDALLKAIDASDPNVVVNAAAYTNVDGAERDPERAMQVNATAVAALGTEAGRRRFGLIHYSTDFVFDGHKRAAYVEDDVAEPLSAYGRTKLAGEVALRQLHAPAIVLRTAWVYSRTNKSFVSSILRLARERTELRVVSDQVGSPTFSRDLAQATSMLLFAFREAPFESIRASAGLYHLAGTGCCSRYDFACSIVAHDPNKHEHAIRAILPVPSDQVPLPAARPLFAPLDCSRIRMRWGIALPPWEQSLKRALQT
jgi:dTDP-4-dehydrorhamnose reductase